MNYLSSISFPNIETKVDFFLKIKQTIYDFFYPFQTLVKHSLERINFDSITILYGRNNYGKTTDIKYHF
ncbi:hypothetical protein CAT7_03239 [Carnobacterium sp. AT7]|nr:hypothetical protein CAT7_03239 [Carnobacterium sp. AT7]